VKFLIYQQSINADKLIFIHHHQWQKPLADTLSTGECETLIQATETPDDLKYLLTHAVQAVKSNIKRVHIIDQLVDGGLLLELFTRNGCGTMVTNLFYEGIRAANIEDVGGILGLIGPLESSGILELEIGFFHVIEKDGMIIGCIACIPSLEHHVAEIACLAVHDEYRRSGFGEQLLQVAELQVSKHGIAQIYTLTTRTSHWFIEHGYQETTSFELPPHKLTQYNQQRRSKVLLKEV
jgi:amino-acid N-acetyltransferase